jgi:glycosyltransferase involved in cell wall biosynthesis
MRRGAVTGPDRPAADGAAARLCFVSLSGYPLFDSRARGTIGGAEVQVYLLATRLAQDHRFDVHVVTADHGQAELERCGPVTLHRARCGPALGGSSVFRLLDRVRRVDADVVVQRAAAASVGLLRLLTTWRGQALLYMTAHEIDCNGAFERQRGRIAGWLFRYGMRRADLVVSQTEQQRALLAVHHGRESLVIPTMHEIPAEQPRVNGRDTVLWVGRCEPGKRPEVFIDLARCFPEERFVMVAPPVAGQVAYYEAVRREAATVRNLEHREFVPYLEIDACFRQARAYVLTSAQEGFPNTIVQAAKHGTPTLSLVVSPDDVLDRYDCGACAGGSVERLRQLLAALLGSGDAWVRQSRNAWRYALTHHDIGPIVDRYKEVLLDLAVRRSRRHGSRGGVRGGGTPASRG